MRSERLLSLLLVVGLTGCVADQPSRLPSYYSGNAYYSANPGPPPRSYEGRAVHISDAVYKAPDGRQCDAKRAVRSMCDGEESCHVKAGNDLCGDPASGVGKRLVIGYKCGDGRVEVAVQEHKSVSLSCPR